VIHVAHLSLVRWIVVLVALAGCWRASKKIEKPVVEHRWLDRVVETVGDVIEGGETKGGEVEKPAEWGSEPLMGHERDGRFRLTVGVLAGTLCDSTMCRGQPGALLFAFGGITTSWRDDRLYHWVQLDTIVGMRELCFGFMCGGELPITGALTTGIGARFGPLRPEIGVGTITAGTALGEWPWPIWFNAIGGRAAIGFQVVKWKHGSAQILAEHQGALLPFAGVHSTGIAIRAGQSL
jgi:hypothetical protein